LAPDAPPVAPIDTPMRGGVHHAARAGAGKLASPDRVKNVDDPKG
jgi:hypothetical protein